MSELITVSEAARRLGMTVQEAEAKITKGKALQGVVSSPLGAEFLVSERFIETIIDNKKRALLAAADAVSPAECR